MINRSNKAWDRLAIVINESGMTMHSFAKHIGLPRSETIYQIKRGQIGISKHVADAVVEHFPEYSSIWLQSGYGTMLANPSKERGYIPYYNCKISQLRNIRDMDVDDFFYLPIVPDFDFAVPYIGEEMAPEIPNGTILILKQIDMRSVMFGNTYVIYTAHIAVLRTVRSTEEVNRLRLVAANSEKFDDLYINRSDVSGVFAIMGKISL